MNENKFKATNQRDAVIEKLMNMKLTSADLEWLAEGLMDMVAEMREEEKWWKA